MDRFTASPNELFAQYYPWMLTWCRRHVARNLAEPEDIVHTAYLRCRRHCPETMTIRFPAAYLERMLRWVLIDALRARRRTPSTPPVPVRSSRRPINAPLGEQIAVESVGLLRGMQKRICQGLLSGKSKQRVLDELNLTTTSYAVHLCRAKATLSAYLKEVD